ncbi:MAG: dihydroxy-acid dehydratase [Desulfobacteraceae bacterium]|nr:dihydroxy-acid dehydratase [Desulfobacteraceae bacterium]
MLWRSKDVITNNATRRALLKSMGYTDYDLKRPLVGIANSWNTFVPGHFNLRQIAAAVSTGISQAGGTPMEFGFIAGCDGLANGHPGMHYILPSRDMIANDIEMMVNAHCLDAVALLGSCDKIVPGMLMAAARMDIPSIIVPGGCMEGGMYFDGRSSDITSLAEAQGMLKAGKITEEEFAELEDNAAPGCGSCSFLGTANSMCCIAEALGMTLPGAGTAPATSALRLRLAQDSGRAVMNIAEKEITARNIINKISLENALKVGMAIGASTNLALHLPAVAYEAEAGISVEDFEKYSRTIPHIARIYPSGPANVKDFHNAGGISAVMKELASVLDLGAMTVTGRTMGENIYSAKTQNPEIIRTMQQPFGREGGLAILRGNLAPDTAISKPAAIEPSMRKFKGKARVFNSEETAMEAVGNGVIKEGDVIVIRYEGPKGGPGMREMARISKFIYGLGLALKTALVTDGRFSGTNNGCFVGHVSPEAAEGGPIAAVNDGDEITIDIPERKLTLHVSEDEIKKRMQQWEKPEPKFKSGYLAIYSRLAESASKGAVIKHRIK